MEDEDTDNTFQLVKSSSLGKLILSAGMTAVTHPLTYVKVLIQVGHEPLAPSSTTTLFGNDVRRLPNFWQYASHIRKVDGVFGLYRGLGPRILHQMIGTSVINSIVNKIKDEDAIDDQNPKSFLVETRDLAIARSAGIIVSYPFHVISVRMMVQFVGRETYYTSIWSSICEIYHEEGILGFFSGLVPYLIGELFSLWISRTINYLINSYVLDNNYSDKEEIKTYTNGFAQYMSSMITYPFQLVTNLMVVNDTRLTAGNPPLMPIFESWTDCWKQLGKKGLRSRGSTLFRRNLLQPL